MHPDDFYSNSQSRPTPPLPTSVNTIGDAIALLQSAANKVGMDTKFRLCFEHSVDDSDEYSKLVDVIVTGKQSLFANRSNKGGEEDTYCLFVYE